MRTYALNGNAMPIEDAPSAKELKLQADKKAKENPHDNFASPVEKEDPDSDHYQGGQTEKKEEAPIETDVPSKFEYL